MSTRICYITGHHFGYRALKGLLDSAGFSAGLLEICLLLTLDASKKSITVGFEDFSALPDRLNFRHANMLSIKSAEAEEMIRSSQPDFIMAIGLSQLLPSRVLDIPAQVNGNTVRHTCSYGCIGMHPTLLPEGRGRAPIPWTIIKGLTHTGVTAFLLEEAADAGGVILQESIAIEPEETATSLFSKCADAHERLGSRLAPFLAEHSLTWTLQDDSKATVWPRRRPEDGEIDFRASVDEVSRLVRGLTSPYPGAFFHLRSEKIVVNRVSYATTPHSYLPGTVTALTNTGLPVIAAGNGLVTCMEIKTTNREFAFQVGEFVSMDQQAAKHG